MRMCKRGLALSKRFAQNTANPLKVLAFRGFFVAEKEGFEPSKPVKVYMISNHAPSTN